MGKRGPKPKPTALRLLHGDRKDRINSEEPVAQSGVPDCPSADPDVRAVWDYTVEQLMSMGTITLADRDTLACYCEAVVTHRKASKILSQSKILIRSKTDADQLVRNPALQAQRDAATLVARFAGHFGLSPSARSEIRKGGVENAPSAARYLNA